MLVFKAHRRILPQGIFRMGMVSKNEIAECMFFCIYRLRAKRADGIWVSAALRTTSDLAPFAFTVRALRARTVNVGFGGASRR
jgi:hypothetical protein